MSPAALHVAPRVAELAAEAVDPARSDLSRKLCAEEVAHRLRRDNPTVTADEVAQAASHALHVAEEARKK